MLWGAASGNKLPQHFSPECCKTRLRYDIGRFDTGCWVLLIHSCNAIDVINLHLFLSAKIVLLTCHALRPSLHPALIDAWLAGGAVDIVSFGGVGDELLLYPQHGAAAAGGNVAMVALHSRGSDSGGLHEEKGVRVLRGHVDDVNAIQVTK